MLSVIPTLNYSVQLETYYPSTDGVKAQVRTEDLPPKPHQYVQCQKHKANSSCELNIADMNKKLKICNNKVNY